MKIDTLTLHELCRGDTLQRLAAFAGARGVRLYLVGGSIRDLLLKRQTADFDFALASNAIYFAKAFAAEIGATCLSLEENPSTARVIVKQGRPSLALDFAQFRGTSLTDDLRSRDLTINAMAVAFEKIDAPAADADVHAVDVIDPCGGLKDLQRGLLQFPSEGVILADPLRLLRVYRFAAHLGFDISEEAVARVRKHRHLLSNVAKERCRDELMKILDVDNARLHLRQMDGIGLLAQVLPSLHRARPLWQPLERFENAPIPTPLLAYREAIHSYLREELGNGVSRLSLIKLGLLLGENVDGIGRQLQLSRRAGQFIKGVVSQSEQFLKEVNPQWTDRGIVRFLMTAASEWWGVLLYAAASRSIDSNVLKRIVETYYKRVVPVREQGRLVTGNDLIQIFHLKEGKQIGNLLEQIEERQFYGEIQTREEALAAVAALIRQCQ